MRGGGHKLYKIEKDTLFLTLCLYTNDQQITAYKKHYHSLHNFLHMYIFYIFTFFPIFTLSFFSKMFIEKDNFSFLYTTNFEIYNWMSYSFFTSSRSKKQTKQNESIEISLDEDEIDHFTFYL